MDANDPKRSRRAKLLSFPPAHLVGLARSWLYDDYGNKSVSHVLKVLTSAAERGSDEAAWLLGFLSQKLPDFGDDQFGALWPWLSEHLAHDATPRGQYYLGRTLFCRRDQLERSLESLGLASKAGFQPATALLADILMSTDDAELFKTGLVLLHRAAEHCDCDAQYYLGRFFLHRLGAENLAAMQFVAAATQGDALSMEELLKWTSRDAEPSPSALALSSRWLGRYVLYSGDGSCPHPHVLPVLSRLSEGRADATDLALLYDLGKSLDGVDQYWDDENRLCSDFERCVDVYVNVMHRARQAALQALVGLRQRVGRDLAVLIGRFVYASRVDVMAWYPRQLRRSLRKRAKT